MLNFFNINQRKGACYASHRNCFQLSDYIGDLYFRCADNIDISRDSYFNNGNYTDSDIF